MSTEATFAHTMPANDVTLTANFQLIINVKDVWDTQMSIFPNPASEYMNLISHDNIITLELFNLTGQMVFGAEVRTNNYKLDISALPQGFYMLKLTSANKEVFTTKVLIAR